MRGFLVTLVSLAVMGLAFWAYRENYETQRAFKKNNEIQRKVGAAHERLSVLRAEWAYLNRPERLRDLADLNFERLGLMPLQPEQFGRVRQISFPPRVSMINNPVDVMAVTDGSAEDGAANVVNEEVAE